MRHGNHPNSEISLGQRLETKHYRYCSHSPQLLNTVIVGVWKWLHNKQVDIKIQAGGNFDSIYDIRAFKKRLSNLMIISVKVKAHLEC